MPPRRSHDRAWRRRAPPRPPRRSERPRAGADRCGADARHAKPPRRGYLRSREHSSPNEAIVWPLLLADAAANAAKAIAQHERGSRTKAIARIAATDARGGASQERARRPDAGRRTTALRESGLEPAPRGPHDERYRKHRDPVTSPASCCLAIPRVRVAGAPSCRCSCFPEDRWLSDFRGSV